MADTAFQILYRQEFVAGFEQGMSLLRGTTTTEAVVKGNQATFLVADSGGATAVTRGVNGLIPDRADNLNQYTATLAEKHDLTRKTGFNVFASQSDQRRIMQMTTTKVINRDIDQVILAELANATQDTGSTTQTATLNTVIWARTILGNNAVDTTDEDNLFAVVSPAFMGYLMMTKEFGSKEYVDIPAGFNRPIMRMTRWAGFNWVEHPNISGKGTNAEKCYFYHRSAIGHAVNNADVQSVVGYHEEQDYSYARTSLFHGAKLLQNAGIVVVTHDGSGFAPT